jgi:glycosyltransferase involved in cell wall biosynthesis
MNDKVQEIFVSVIIPTYNRVDVLELCLNSILEQTLSSQNYEVIIVDDCSKDSTEEVCNRYSLEYNNVVYIRNQFNQGLATTRNNGIEISKGDMLIFLDNDLIVNNDYIEQHLTKHRSCNFEKIAIVSNITYKPEFLKQSNFGQYIQSRAIGYRSDEYMKGIDINDLSGNFFAGGGSSCLKKFVIENGKFNQSLKKYGLEDELFGFHFKKNGGRIIYHHDAKVIHYDNKISPMYWKLKYVEMGKYSLKELFEIEKEYFLQNNYNYLNNVDLSNDSFKDLFMKTMISFFSISFFRTPIEFYINKTDKISFLKINLLYRYICAAWLKCGYKSQTEIESVVY